MLLFKPTKITLTPINTKKSEKDQNKEAAKYLVEIEIEKINSANNEPDAYLKLANQLKRFSESQIDLSYHDPKKKFLYCTYDDEERRNLLYFINSKLREMKIIDWFGDVIFLGKFKDEIFKKPILVDLEFSYINETGEKMNFVSHNTYYFKHFNED